MPYTENWNRYVAIRAQSGLGTRAVATGGQIIYTSGGAGGLLSKQAVESAIPRRDGQSLRGRHGSRRTTGAYSSELGIGRFDPIMEAVFRSSFVPELVLTSAGFTSVTTTANTIVAATGSWIALGLRVGDVIRLANHPSAGNNGRNLRITGLTANTITVAETLTVNASASTTTTVTRTGRKLVNAAGGAMVKRYFTVEEHEFDQDASEIFDDCVFSRFGLSMAPDGNVNTEFGWTGTGKSEVLQGASAPYFSGLIDPAELSLVAVEATVRFKGADLVALTSFDFSVDLQPSAPAVAGSAFAPDVFLGTFSASMNMTMLRGDLQALADFSAETPLSLHVLAENKAKSPADFISLHVPNFTLGSVAKSAIAKAGGATTVQLGIPAELIGIDMTGGAFDQTTAKIQISNAS